MGQSSSKVEELVTDAGLLGESLSCSNCGKESEPGKALQRCSACQSVHYCSKECQKKHWAEAHKNQCKEMTKNVPEWFPHPENLLRVVKRTGMSRVGALSLLEKCRDGKGTFPGNSADEMEAYAMTAWVMHLGKQLKAFDSKLEVNGRLKTPAPARPSMFVGWFGRGATKEGDASLESLHQGWVKGGKVKGASHESFFDTEFLLEEIKLQREVLTKFNELWGGGDGEPLDEAMEEEVGELLELLAGEDLPRPGARKVILVMGPIGNDRAKRTAKIVRAICSWAPPAPGSTGDIPEELAIAAAEGEGVELRPWQVRALLHLLGVKTASEGAREALRKAAIFQIKEQKRAMDLCRSLPKKVTDAMTCSECCKDRVLLTQETIDGMEKYMTKAVNTPWVVGEQHLKMNEFLTSMDQVAEQLKELAENDYAMTVRNSVHTELIKCAYETVTELCDEAWVANVNGAAGVLMPGEELPGLGEDEIEGDDEPSKDKARQDVMAKRLVEVYRTSTKMRVASEAYDKDESLQEALANFGATAPTNLGRSDDSEDEDSDED